MDGISELAKMFKDRENTIYTGPQVGEVITPPPEIKVRLGDRIILTKENLIIAAHLIEPSDNLNSQDEVIIIPTADGQKYFLIDKAVSL